MSKPESPVGHADLAQRVLGATPDHISILGSDYTYRYVNPAYEAAHDLEAEDIIGMTVSSLLGPEFFTSIAKPALDRCLAGEEIEYDAWFEFEKTGRRYMSVRYLPMVSSADTADEVLVISTDITARKHAEMALAKSEEKYRHYITSAPHGVFIVDERGRYLEINPAARRMTGFDEAELLQMAIIDLVPEEDRADVMEDFARLQSEGALQDRFQLRTKTSGPIWVDLVAVQIGERRFIGFCEDVTAELETAQQLRQAQKMEALGLLAGGIAHDFNNLLMAIMGYSEVMLADVSTARHEHCLGEIVNVTHRAADLVRQLLTFSSRSAPPCESVDVNAAVLQLRKMLARLIGKQIRIETKLEPTLPLTACQRTGLDQILVNLVVNARDAMPNGGQLEISTSAVSLAAEDAKQRGLSAGEYVRVAVIDDGEGMSEEVRSRLFEPFFTTKAPGRGTGLGLSVTYGIVRGFGGHISVHSTLGEGTRISVLLPSATSPSEEVVEEEPAAQTTNSASILLVDDEPALRSLLRRLLTHAGYEVIVAERPSEALEFVRSAERIDLLLTDVVMPNMNGGELFEACVQLRPELRVLFMSGYAGLAGPDLELSDHPLLDKPFSAAELTRAVQRALGG